MCSTTGTGGTALWGAGEQKVGEEQMHPVKAYLLLEGGEMGAGETTKTHLT